MAKTKYTYSGAAQVISLRKKDGKGNVTEDEVVLRPGKDVELDPDSPYVKSLIARGFLKPVAAAAGGTSKAPECPPGKHPEAFEAGPTEAMAATGDGPAPESAEPSPNKKKR